MAKKGRHSGCTDQDARLMLRAAKGDSSAFGQLYGKYMPLVTLYLIGLNTEKASAEDLTQEVFVRLWARREKYRGDSKFKTYLFSHVSRVLLEQQRFHTRRRTLADRLSQDSSRVVASPRAPQAEAVRAELKEQVGRAITELTAQQAQALKLYYSEEMSLRKAAESAACSVKCFESRLIRARRKLGRILSEAECENVGR